MKNHLRKLAFNLGLGASALALASCERPEQVCASKETLDGISGIFFKEAGADDASINKELHRKGGVGLAIPGDFFARLLAAPSLATLHALLGKSDDEMSGGASNEVATWSMTGFTISATMAYSGALKDASISVLVPAGETVESHQAVQLAPTGQSIVLGGSRLEQLGVPTTFSPNGGGADTFTPASATYQLSSSSGPKSLTAELVNENVPAGGDDVGGATVWPDIKGSTITGVSLEW